MSSAFCKQIASLNVFPECYHPIKDQSGWSEVLGTSWTCPAIGGTNSLVIPVTGLNIAALYSIQRDAFIGDCNPYNVTVSVTITSNLKENPIFSLATINTTLFWGGVGQKNGSGFGGITGSGDTPFSWTDSLTGLLDPNSGFWGLEVLISVTNNSGSQLTWDISVTPSVAP